MRKWLVLILLACVILSGCSKSKDGDTSTQQPVNTGQEETIQEEASVDEDETAAEGTLDRYIAKLNNIEENLSDLQDLYDEGTTVSLSAAEEETYKRWDAALNEIYSALKEQLSESEMADLKDKQLDWITHRDETAKKESSAYEGGTMESLQFISTKARVTKERCYELVELYMK